jgi:hypothetical protein
MRCKLAVMVLLLSRGPVSAAPPADAGAPVSAIGVSVEALKARLESGDRLDQDLERFLARTAASARDTCCSSARGLLERSRTRFVDAQVRASRLLFHPSTQREVNAAEQELAYFARVLDQHRKAFEEAATHQTGRADTAPPSSLTLSLEARELTSGLACYQLNHLTSQCSEDSQCTAIRAGCGATAIDQDGLPDARTWSEACTPVCPAVDSSTHDGAQCERQRCVLKEYPGWMSDFDVCFARASEQGGPAVSSVQVALLFGEGRQVREASVLPPPLAATAFGRCVAAAASRVTSRTAVAGERVTITVTPQHGPQPPLIHADYRSTSSAGPRVQVVSRPADAGD